MSQPERRRTGSSGTRRKSKRTAAKSAFWVKVGLGCLVGVAVVALMVWLVPKAMQSFKKGVAAANQPAWPMPPETPEAELYGSGDVGPIVPCTPEKAYLALRPRSVDPEFRISNLRNGQSKSGQPTLLIDVELVKSNGPVTKIRVSASSSRGGYWTEFSWNNPPGGVKEVELYPPWPTFGQTPAPNPPPPFNIGTDWLVAWVEVRDTRYTLRNPLQEEPRVGKVDSPFAARFKVSPTFQNIQAGSSDSSAREWHPDEIKLFRTSGGEARIFFPNEKPPLGTAPDSNPFVEAEPTPSR